LLLVALFSILLAEPAAAAIDRVFVGGGQGDGVDIAAVGFGLSEWASWEVWGAHLSASAVAKAQDWDGREARLNDKKVWDVSFTPTLRLRSQRSDWQPYAELGLGIHLLSRVRINENRTFSTAFQFGEFLGMGVVFGSRRQWDLSAHVEHVSNGGIREPNAGITFGAVILQYRFR
jgi:lipid A 3-O-deacylase